MQLAHTYLILESNFILSIIFDWPFNWPQIWRQSSFSDNVMWVCFRSKNKLHGNTAKWSITPQNLVQLVSIGRLLRSISWNRVFSSTVIYSWLVSNFITTDSKKIESNNFNYTIRFSIKNNLEIKKKSDFREKSIYDFQTLTHNIVNTVTDRQF